MEQEEKKPTWNILDENWGCVVRAGIGAILGLVYFIGWGDSIPGDPGENFIQAFVAMGAGALAGVFGVLLVGGFFAGAMIFAPVLALFDACNGDFEGAKEQMMLAGMAWFLVALAGAISKAVSR